MLDGMRVVDLSTEIAGPYCTKLLADAGADVVKVEAPDGDPLRTWRSGALFEFLHTSRRSIVGAPDDDHVLDLCANADLVVENGLAGRWRSGVLQAGLRERNPGLVAVSITPFGQDGPWADWAASEFTLQAWCGSIATRGLPEAPPVAAGGRIGEWVAGTYAAVAALGAWLQSTRTGVGEHIDVALLDCMALTMNTYTAVFAEFLGWPPMRRPTRSIEIPSLEPTADGYVGVTTNSAQQFADFLLLIDRPDLLDDEDLSISISRFKRRDEVHEFTHAYTLQHTTEEVLEKATLLRIPNGPVGNGELVTGFDHFQATGTFVENPRGRFVQPHVPYRISGLSSRPFTASPDIGADDGTIDWKPRERTPIELLRGEPHTAPGAPADDERPLSGLRVLDCTAWWAGPAATHMLACLGADVIKVESVTRPDQMRFTSTKRPPEDLWWEWGPLFHGANNGKRGITLDLTRPEGRDLLLDLAGTADVFLENFSPRVMEQFDLGWEALHERNPELVMVRLPAYGLQGPWRDRTGFAQTMEAITGMAWVTGWPDGPPLLPRGACDPLAAMHAVFATLLALHDRATTGDGHLVEVTMIEAALNAAAEQVVEFGASGTLLGRNGNRGPLAAPQNLYACAGHEEWLALAIMDDEQWVTLRKVLDDPAWAAEPALETAEGRFAAHDEIDAHLAAWCETRDARALAEMLASHGIPAGYVEDARDIANNPQLVDRGFLEVEEHAITGSNRIPMVPFRYEGRADRDWMLLPSPSLGEHNDEILGGELGLTAEQLAHLREIAVIGDRPVGA